MLLLSFKHSWDQSFKYGLKMATNKNYYNLFELFLHPESLRIYDDYFCWRIIYLLCDCKRFGKRETISLFTEQWNNHYFHRMPSIRKSIDSIFVYSFNNIKREIRARQKEERLYRRNLKIKYWFSVMPTYSTSRDAGPPLLSDYSH